MAAIANIRHLEFFCFKFSFLKRYFVSGIFKFKKNYNSSLLSLISLCLDEKNIEIKEKETRLAELTQIVTDLTASRNQVSCVIIQNHIFNIIFNINHLLSTL